MVSGRAHRHGPATWVGGAIAVVALALGWFGGVGATPPAPAPLRLGVALPTAGPNAPWGVPMLQGVQLAVEEVNRRGGAGGRPLETLHADTSDHAPDTPSLQRAVIASYERLLADPLVIAVIGPQTSPESRVAAPLLSRANLATITPSATTFDLTDPGLRATFRPGGRTVYFRSIGTDVAQGDAMARFAEKRLGVRRVVVISDGSSFGDRTIRAFERRAAQLGIAILGRRLVNWVGQDYREELRDVARLQPDTLYLGVRAAAGVKLARQILQVLPSVRVLGTETLYDRAFPLQARPGGGEGWYVPHVGPDPAMSPAATAWAARYRTRFGAEPSAYSLTAYTAVMIVADAVERVTRAGRPVTRASVRDAIQATRLPDAPSGPVSFGPDGDLERAMISIFQVRGGAFRYVETIASPGAGDGLGAKR